MHGHHIHDYDGFALMPCSITSSLCKANIGIAKASLSASASNCDREHCSGMGFLYVEDSVDESVSKERVAKKDAIPHQFYN